MHVPNFRQCSILRWIPGTNFNLFLVLEKLCPLKIYENTFQQNGILFIIIDNRFVSDVNSVGKDECRVFPSPDVPLLDAVVVHGPGAMIEAMTAVRGRPAASRRLYRWLHPCFGTFHSRFIFDQQENSHTNDTGIKRSQISVHATFCYVNKLVFTLENRCMRATRWTGG